MDRQTVNRQMDSQTDGRRDGRTEGRRDGGTDGRRISVKPSDICKRQNKQQQNENKQINEWTD